VSLRLVHTVAELRAAVGQWRGAGLRFGYVPTMGALHDGHLSLVAQALEKTDRVGVSIFVNPTQFGPREDFDAYPRPLEQDLEKLEACGAHLAFVPKVEEMYPEGFSTAVSVSGLTEELEGAHRPGHFAGVATVVTKLLTQALPDVAVFGNKDYQQLCVIRRLVRDLDLPVEVEGAHTVREADGLALSSRNVYLSPEQRRTAATLYTVLVTVAEEVAEGAAPALTCAAGIKTLLSAGFEAVDYLEVRDAETLVPWTNHDRPARVLAAARLGRTRLLDNLPVSR